MTRFEVIIQFHLKSLLLFLGAGECSSLVYLPTTVGLIDVAASVGLSPPCATMFSSRHFIFLFPFRRLTAWNCFLPSLLASHKCK